MYRATPRPRPVLLLLKMSDHLPKCTGFSVSCEEGFVAVGYQPCCPHKIDEGSQ